MSFSFYEINFSKIKQNVQSIKNKLKGSKLCAMIKGNAYGLGIVDVAKAICNDVDFFGVACVSEAMAIRKNKICTPILIVGTTLNKDINWCAKHNVRITISCLEMAKLTAKMAKFPLKVHIKINTGMNRYGLVDNEDLKQVLCLLNSNKNIVIEGAFTHFATKQEDPVFCRLQHERFIEIVSKYKLNNKLLHCCSSFSAAHYPEFLHGMARIGFALYNKYEVFDCKSALSIKSKIVCLQDVICGESVGYSKNFIAKKDTKVGVVALGYADGFDRRLSNRASVLIHGHYAPVIGYVCMDVFMVDLSNVDDAKLGDEVVILGEQGENKIALSDYAKWLDTSEYEIMQKFNYRRMTKKRV